MKTGEKYYLNDTSLIGIWQIIIEFSPLRETYLIKKRTKSLRKLIKCNSCNWILGRQWSRKKSFWMGDVLQKMEKAGGAWVCHWKVACILVFLFPPFLRLSLVTMQRFSFISFLLLWFALIYTTKSMIQQQLSRPVTDALSIHPTSCHHPPKKFPEWLVSSFTCALMSLPCSSSFPGRSVNRNLTRLDWGKVSDYCERKCTFLYLG